MNGSFRGLAPETVQTRRRFAFLKVFDMGRDTRVAGDDLSFLKNRAVLTRDKTGVEFGRAIKEWLETPLNPRGNLPKENPHSQQNTD